MEAVRLVKGGQAVPVTAKMLGVPSQTLGNWVKLSNQGQLKGAGDKPVSPEQMELARLRAENARLRMERDILGKATAYFAKGSKLLSGQTHRVHCCTVHKAWVAELHAQIGPP